MKQYKNILVCTGFSEDANKAIHYAIDLAKKNEARLHILHIPHSPYAYLRHVVDEHTPEGAPDGEAFFSEEVAKIAAEALKDEYEKTLGDFKNYSFAVECGTPWVEIIRYAVDNGVDEIVMGSRGKYDVDRAERGSTVDNVSRYSRFHVTSVNGKPLSRGA